MSKFESKADEGIFVGYATDSRTYRVFNKSSRKVEESCNVRFDENDGSLVEQVDVCDAGDEIPSRAIRRWEWACTAPLRNTFW